MGSEDTQSWYARKLAQMRGAPPQPFVQHQPAPVYQPQHQPQGYQQPVPPYQQNYAPAPQAQGGPHAQASLTQLLDLQRQGQALNPGKGARLNPHPCPNCGGALYFADLGQKRRGPPPAPRCFNCGFNDLFEQGLESTWVTGT